MEHEMPESGRASRWPRSGTRYFSRRRPFRMAMGTKATQMVVAFSRIGYRGFVPF